MHVPDRSFEGVVSFYATVDVWLYKYIQSFPSLLLPNTKSRWNTETEMCCLLLLYYQVAVCSKLKAICRDENRQTCHISIGLFRRLEGIQRKSQHNLQRSECLTQSFEESTQHNKWAPKCLKPAVCSLKATHSGWRRAPTSMLSIQVGYLFWATAGWRWVEQLEEPGIHMK